MRSLYKTIIIIFVLLFPMKSTSETIEQYLFLFCNNGLYGYENYEKEVVITPNWDIAFPFWEGIAKVGIKTDNDKMRYGLIDYTGKYVVEPVYDQIDLCSFCYGSGKYYELENDNILNVFDVKERKLIHISKSSEAQPLQSGQYIAVKDLSSKLWGYIDYSGNMIIPYEFDEASSFVNGYGFIEVWENNYIFHYLINAYGERIELPLNIEAYSIVQNGKYIIRSRDTNKYGIGQIDGSIVIEPRYDYIFDFHCGVAIFSQLDKYGCIDDNGTILVPPLFDYIEWEDNKFVAELYEHLYTIDFTNLQIEPFEDYRLP